MAGKIVSKLMTGVGGLGLLAVGYDAHKNGVQYATSLPRRKETDTIGQMCLGLASSESDSNFGRSVQNSFVNFRTKTNLFANFYSVVGYLGGILGVLKGRIIPIAFGCAAVLGEGLIKSAGVLGLGVCAVNFAFSNIFKSPFK